MNSKNNYFQPNQKYNMILIVGKHNTKIVDELLDGKIYNSKLILTEFDIKSIESFTKIHIKNSNDRANYHNIKPVCIHIKLTDVNNHNNHNDIFHKKYNSFTRLFTSGRHYKIDVIVEMDQFPMIPPHIRSNIDLIILFPNKENNVMQFNKYYRDYQLPFDHIDGCYIYNNRSNYVDGNIGGKLYLYRPKQIKWTPALHHYFNKEFKKCISILFSICAKNENTLSKINYNILYKIIELIAVDEY